MVNYTSKRLCLPLLLTLGASFVLAFILQETFLYSRSLLCANSNCLPNAVNLEPIKSSSSPIETCIVSAYLLSRSNERRIRDRILLLGRENSVGEYLLPFLHLSTYDKSLVDPKYERKGISAVKYGYPFSIANQSIRYWLFRAGIADAVVISPGKNSPHIHPRDIRYLFRLQPYVIRRELPNIHPSIGVSEDSEVLKELVSNNPSLFKAHLFTCP